MKAVLVLGANGQLGSCLKEIASSYSQFVFTFLSSTQCNVTSELNVQDVILKGNYDYCVNCAAYTNVDKSEDEVKDAFDVNTFGPRFLAQACAKSKTVLVHISTDFVFDGEKGSPYLEDDITNPLGVYGKSKLEGEREIIKNTSQYFIIRTSWLYSEYGKNFVKTMINLSQKENTISVVNDQIGSPTYAVDLAYVILEIIQSKSTSYGIYHFSNNGSISWFDLALKVFELKNIEIVLRPIKTKDYPTRAKRPRYSVLDTEKIEHHFQIKTGDWQHSLSKALKKIHD